MSSRPPARTTLLLVVAAALAGLLAALAFWRGGRLPGPGDPAYQQTTRAFYYGLAALEVGLLDDAREQFTRAAGLVEEEPASWVNLGVTELRRGELDAAEAPMQRALSLAPDDSAVVLAAGRMEIARGRLDEGIAHLRRAVALDPGSLRARYALADEIARSGASAADEDALAQLDELARLAPENLAVLVERARVAARAGDAERLRDSATRIGAQATGWPDLVLAQYQALQEAVAAGNLEEAGRRIVPLRNVLASVPAFREDLAAVQTPSALIAEPLTQFIALEPPPATPAAADASLSFETVQIAGDRGAAAGTIIVFPRSADGEPAIVAAGSGTAYVAGGDSSWEFVHARDPAPAAALLALDWNNDFRTDVALVGAGGIRLMLQQDDGSFAAAAMPPPGEGIEADCCFGAWAADVEMDGDLDIVLARLAAGPLVLRNNGDGTWTGTPAFPGVSGARGFAWADLDRDVDPDAVFLEASGAIRVFTNRQAGDFAPVSDLPGAQGAAALTVADLDADGIFDIVVLEPGGAVRRMWRESDGWHAAGIAEWEGLEGAAPGDYRLIAADLDNNGALDLVAAGAGQTRIWLAGEDYRLAGLAAAPEGEVFAVADLDADGRLDLLGIAGNRVVRHAGRGEAPYHWKVVRPRAQEVAGDQRINSFGVGGEIQVRSGLLVQKQVLSGQPVHVGLGTRTAIDVARIVWPNGVAQAEFGIGVDDAIVAEQRLKGSCPWVFVWDGERMRFVADFLWRSPLGLRINAQDTAGVSQTEDWVRIDGEHLAPREGAYDVRITAELWETHFVDHVALLVVDHPAGTEVFVDERFSPAAPPALEVRAFHSLRPVSRAWDDRGHAVTGLVSRQDGRYLATFARGRYQGIASDHFVELELEPADGPRVLLASGWIYPTDSSINVAIGQGVHPRPRGLSLEAQQPDGRWTVVHPDLGYPAGKNKTVLIDLSAARGARRLRLRTNLEIYWDALAVATPADAPLQTVRLDASRGELRFRGFSETVSPRGDAPETPLYDRMASTTQQWRDLEGFHTRFGDVTELLATVDDRYVIMNAGDELRLTFPEQPPPPEGWERDFVLIGDGWEKDGDYNTGYSRTVLPLPSHDNPEYRAASEPPALERDPVYRRYPEDWVRYHTRYVAPDTFVQGVR